MDILIYAGNGTSKANVVQSSVEAALKFLGLHDQYKVKAIQAETLYERYWLSSTKLLVIPGGRDLPYTEDLTGVSLRNIKEFINCGGSYLGLCAGAYFSCNYVLFEKGTPMEVIGKRDLDLFHGTAKGSVYHPFVYNSTKGSRVVPVSCKDTSVTTAMNSFAYFNGGCEFLPDEGFQDYTTVAMFEQHPDKKAIISRQLGKGKLILSGVHPEIDILYLDSSEYTAEQWEIMQTHAIQQRNLFHCFMKFLLVNEDDSKL